MASAFQILAKPAGAACNLDCGYCYYAGKGEDQDKGPARMPDAVLERYIAQRIAADSAETVMFVWHGGEPTVLGLDYFRRIVDLQRRYRPRNRRIANCIQTNGVLVDEAWSDFLASEKFFVGLSLDGPRELHDAYRRSRAGAASHGLALHAFRLLMDRKVPCDVLCVVHERNVARPDGVYDFFRGLGVEYLQFLPFTTPTDRGVVCPVTANEYGEFLCSVFSAWLRNDVGRIAIQNFEEVKRVAYGNAPTLCVFREVCGDVPVIERNGDLYACDHFVEPAYHLGNIAKRPLGELLSNRLLREFGAAKRDRLPRFCRECDVLSFCNGGCPKDRTALTPDGETGLNMLCEGMRAFYRHSRPYLDAMAELLLAGRPESDIMDILRARRTAMVGQAGKNQRCPCGSGKKFKKCCLNS